VSSVDVVVVGAGLAGLSSARQLRTMGASVALLEARDRIGGRAKSEEIPEGITLDLGAQFIGDSQPRINALVNEAGLTRVKSFTHGDGLYFDFAGSVNSSQRVKGDSMPLNILQQLDLFRAQWKIDRIARNLETHSKRLFEISALQFLQEATISKQASKVLAQIVEPETCYPLDRISAFHLVSQINTMGGMTEESESAGWFLKEGIGGVLNHLLEEIRPSLHLNSPALKFTRKSGKIEVETSLNKFVAKDVIVAVPPHLYKRMGLYEVLTPEVQSEINFFQPGIAIKTILVFEQPWWRENGLTGRSIGGGGLFNATLDASPEDNSSGVLILFSTSKSGTSLSELKLESERVKAAIKWLEGFGVQPIPKLIASRSIDWNSGPLALGGYANAGTLGGTINYSQLFNSIEGLHFAGSETATEWSSFMEGALQSAERAVERIKNDS